MIWEAPLCWDWLHKGQARFKKLPQRRQMLLCHHWSTWCIPHLLLPVASSLTSLLALHAAPTTHPPPPTPNPSPGISLHFLCSMSLLRCPHARWKREGAPQANCCLRIHASVQQLSPAQHEGGEKQAGCVYEVVLSLLIQKTPGQEGVFLSLESQMPSPQFVFLELKS